MKVVSILKIICLGFALVSFQLLPAQGAITCTSNTQLNQLIKTGNVIVDCHAERRCPPCRMLAPVFTKVASDMENVTFVKVNVDEVEVSGIRGVPTLIFYKDGKEIARKTGTLNESALRDLIKKNFGL